MSVKLEAVAGTQPERSPVPVTGYRDLRVWQHAMELVVRVYHRETDTLADASTVPRWFALTARATAVLLGETLTLFRQDGSSKTISGTGQGHGGGGAASGLDATRRLHLERGHRRKDAPLP